MSGRLGALLMAAAVFCLCGLIGCARTSETAAKKTEPGSTASESIHPERLSPQPVQDSDSAPSEEEAASRELFTYYGKITAQTSQRESAAGTYYTRSYNFFGGDIFETGRLVTSSDQPACILMREIKLKGEVGTIRHHDGLGWHEDTLSECTLEDGMYFINTDSQQLIICLPTAYRPLSNGVIEEIEDMARKLYIQKSDAGWKLSAYTSQTQSGAHIEYMLLLSQSELINWNDQQAELDWAGFLFSDKSRWTYDGYYYSTPNNYYPTGEKCFHRLVSAYITTKFIDVSRQYRAARVMGLAMLDVMCGQQNSEGYFPTMAGSTWLKEEYDINTGFFDTRFNADLVLAMLKATKELGADFFGPTIDRFGSFYLSYVQNHGISRNGWTLVPDYWHPGGCRVTHTSLNHQCAETLMLLRFFEYSADERYYDLAMSMLLGICEKAEFWMSGEDGNLNYAWYFGSNIGSDYPYLTYNDMYKLQDALLSLRGSIDDTLGRLMNHKLAWMSSHGVTDYMK